ncbi:MAG: DUF488 domain-containing protein [Nitrospirae bacterium]|nr:DUF488 domain-containing protein [Nitrospirota bacterium]
MKEKIIYTLGTSRRTEEDFIEILLAYGIACLIDVRRFPKSKIHGFSKEELIESLYLNGIRYYWLEGLGGFRKGGYEAYSQTEEFKNAVSGLEEIAKQAVSVVLCAERFPWKCHRRWIARELQRRGWHVIHIIDKDKVWEPKTA